MRKEGQKSTGYWAAEYARWRSGGLSQRAYCQGRGYSLYGAVAKQSKKRARSDFFIKIR